MHYATHEDNWMNRFLSNKEIGAIYKVDFLTAKKALKTKAAFALKNLIFNQFQFIVRDGSVIHNCGMTRALCIFTVPDKARRPNMKRFTPPRKSANGQSDSEESDYSDSEYSYSDSYS